MLALTMFASGDAAAQTVVSASNGAELQAAIGNVPNGGIIELAGGTYSAPNGSFEIFKDANGASKTFTIRATQGANVVLTGGGGRGIVLFTSSKLVTFQNINFISGSSNTDSFGSVISMSQTEANFIGCTFQNNTSTAPNSGGGVRVDTSTASFQNCSWTNNTSTSFGAAMVVDKSTVFIRNCQFVGNRIDVSGHVGFSAGGAITANTSKLRVANSRFENNHAAYVGGAIYAYGPWQQPYTNQTMDLEISNCVFSNNSAAKLQSDPAGAPDAGGAVMMEDQTFGRIYNSRFINNTARQGGALCSYRTRTEIQNSVFDGNLATGSGPGEGYGGAIIILSDDNLDASTGNGQFNRPSAQLTVSDSIFRGTPGTFSAGQGGGISVSGDVHSNFGAGGVQKRGTPEENRAIVTLQRVAFVNLAVANAASQSGGALAGDFVALTADNCIIENSGANSQGGGFRFVQQSVVSVTNSTFASNAAGSLGGGFAMSGGDVHLTDDNFLDNGITGNGNGSAMWLRPGDSDGTVPAQDITGAVQGCTFNSSSSTTDLIYDGDNISSPPYNRVQYNSNRFDAAKPAVIVTSGIGEQTVDQLNSFTYHHRDGTTVVKSTGGNTFARTPFPAGALLLLPPGILQSGAPGESLPLASYLIYASSGGATLDGAAQRASSGVVQTTTTQQHVLNVGSETFTTTPPPAVALNISTRLPVGQNENALIGGFIIVGPSPKRVLIRGIGPSLPVAGALQDPVLELHSGASIVAQNDDWANTQVGGAITADQTMEILSTTIPPASSREPAMIVSVNPGAYTAVVRGKNNTTGNALVEIYDLDPVQSSTLANISTRGFVQTGDNVMIGGFIYTAGSTATRVVVRGLGPSLRASGVTNALADPALDLVNSQGTTVATNDDWQTTANAADLQRHKLAPSDPKEAALYRTGLAPGSYTAVLHGANGGTGIGLLEVYVF